MDYKLQLLKEHSRSNTDIIAKAIGNSAVELKKIIDIIYTEKAPLPQRASWLLPTINKKYPELLVPHIPLFLTSIKKIKIDGIKRNMVAVLASNTISKNLQGKLVNLCFDLLLSSDETVVVKVHAMQAIANITKHHPELQNELKVAIEDQWPKTSAAFHAR
ncbi:MAG: hypothetical protein K8R85_06780, partial [Bacteroidetes bacterium]|nr:hypothetical protein [Bacteroidota bacterium]